MLLHFLALSGDRSRSHLEYLQLCETINSEILLFVFCFFYFLFIFHRALDVSSEKMCPGESSEYISENSWEGLEEQIPGCGRAGDFCELVSTSC